MPEPYGIETAGSFGTGNAYVIVTVGTTDFTLIGAVDNRIGVVFEATGAGSGTGTARRLNSQLGRIGGKLLADNLLRDGIDLAFKNTAYDTPVLYLKIDPEVKDTVSAGSFVSGIKYRIRTQGTTNFLLIGSLSNTIGTIFTATGAGTGTGTADLASDSITDTDAADALDPTSNQGAGLAVGFNTDTPAYDLDIDNDAKTTNVEATSQANISNIIINAAGYVSTTVGSLYISPSGHDPIINFDRMTSDDLFFSDNVIGSFADADIELNPSGTGTIELESTANITGDFNVSGSVTIDGNLTTPGSIAFGDSTFTAPSIGDTLDFNTFISQNLNPGIDNEFNLGMPNNKWGNLWAPDWTNISNLRPSTMRISDQQILDGVAMEIRSLQSNDDLLLSPDTGVLYVEELKFDDVDGTLLYTIDNPNSSGTSAGDLFGYSMAANENYLIVGALDERNRGTGGNDGAAYIFDVNDGSLIRTVNPGSYGSIRSNAEAFGTSVGITDEYFIVGDQEVYGTTGSFGGRAWIFRTSNGSLLHTLFLPTGGSSKYFGRGVAISDSYAIVGAPGDRTTSFNAGQAWIYSTATGTILHQLAPTRTRGEFGHAVAISETYAVVGAPLSDAPNYRSGTVYIFSSSTGTLLHTIDNPNPFGTSGDDRFGWSVAVSGDRVIVGAYTDSEAAGASSGRAYIFNASTGALIHRLDNPNAFGTVTGDNFGRSVAISGNRAIVGAWLEDDSGGINSGKAYIFSVSDGSLLNTLDNPNAYGTSGSDYFGFAVSISSDRAIVGAYWEDDAGGTDSGKVYGYSLRGAKITNLNTSTPVQFASTGAGYLRFMGSNAFVIPAGDSSTRPSAPELGDTRWNTDEQYLECFDGSVYVIATGGGDEVTEELMEEFGNVYSLILG